MSLTLLILAAGMGSRYGGLKQLDAVGPSGETLLDYSVHDALRAGFDRVVFVIRRDFEKEFRERIGSRYERHVAVDYVFQGMDVLPAGSAVPADRTKPLGTGHAIWCAHQKIQEPFAAINADDFYGAEAFRSLARFFAGTASDTRLPELAMVGYRLGNTLSEHGSVARGICSVDDSGYLLGVEEQVGLEKTETGAALRSADGTTRTFAGAETVSMNFWGLTPAIFPLLEESLKAFLARLGTDQKAEFYIPSAIAEMIQAELVRVKVLTTDSDWFGVTYREDKPLVVESIARLVEAGIYPANLTAPEVVG